MSATVIWLLFVWNPQAHFMQAVQWFPTEAACRAEIAARHWPQEAPPTCGAVKRGAQR